MPHLISHSFHFLCPVCFSEDSLSPDECRNCNVKISLRGSDLLCNGQIIKPPQYFDLLEEKLIPENPASLDDALLENIAEKPLRRSKTAILKAAAVPRPMQGYHRWFSHRLDDFEPKKSGRLFIFKKHLEFHHNQQVLKWPIEAITCMGTTGSSLLLKTRGKAVLYLKFPDESHLKYEILLRKWLDNHYRAAGREILEYQPLLRFQPARPVQRYWQLPADKAPAEREFLLETMVMSSIAFLLRVAFSMRIQLKIRNRHLYNHRETAIVLVNHQSHADPFIVSAFLDRKIAFITKSAAFLHWFTGLFLKWARGIPTHKYMGDPQVIRAARAFLKKNVKVGVFPEAERCWDGRLRPFKIGLVKTILAARKPIYPIVLDGAYDFWPRWSKKPLKGPVTMTIGAPFCLIPELYTIEEQRRFLEDYFKHVLAGNPAGKNPELQADVSSS